MTQREYFLNLVAEEATELAMACQKALRFGEDDRRDEGGQTNIERVYEELIDVVATVSFVYQATGKQMFSISNEIIFSGKRRLEFERKWRRINHYMHYSRITGSLDTTTIEEGLSRRFMPIDEDEMRFIINQKQKANGKEYKEV